MYLTLSYLTASCSCTSLLKSDMLITTLETALPVAIHTVLFNLSKLKMEKVDFPNGRLNVAPNFGDQTMPIAIIGMGCRFPGEATNPERLWQMCAEQRDVWKTIPQERFTEGVFYHPDPSRNGTVSDVIYLIKMSILSSWNTVEFPRRAFSARAPWSFRCPIFQLDKCRSRCKSTRIFLDGKLLILLGNGPPATTPIGMLLWSSGEW